MREYLSHTETHHSVQCPPPHQTEAGIVCAPRRPWTVNRGVTFPESAGTRGPATATHLEMRGAIVSQ
jgi:hypothetical protein